ncbi:MAG: hypothetical protein Q9164_007779 [Protoblastenia rupestris]
MPLPSRLYRTPSPSAGSPAPAPAPAPADPASVFDRKLLASNRSLRMIQSWIPVIETSGAGLIPKDTEAIVREIPEEPQGSKDAGEMDPERAGLGVGAMDAQRIKQEQTVADERLRRSILGRDWKMKAAANSRSNTDKGSEATADLKPRPRDQERQEDNDLEDEECRSALGTRKRSGGRPAHTTDGGDSDSRYSMTRKRGIYLDEILSTRRKRKKPEN